MMLVRWNSYTRGDMKTIEIAAAVLVCFSASVSSAVPVSGSSMIRNSWNEKRKVHTLQRRISTAINVYAENGTVPRIRHEEGVYEGVEYDILRVDPDEHTFLKVDYSETPEYLDELYDPDLEKEGFTRAAGINAVFFDNTEIAYGRPVGGVMINGEWTNWNGEENTPAYGSGFATVYFNRGKMEIRYHGWENGAWKGDEDWSYWCGYAIEAENAVSGAFTYFIDGKEQDITDGEHGVIDYHKTRRALTILAQKEDLQYLLIEFYGGLSEEKVLEFLREEGVMDAIRMGGGGSTSMVYLESEVNQEYPVCPADPDLPQFGAEAIAERQRRGTGFVAGDKKYFW